MGAGQALLELLAATPQVGQRLADPCEVGLSLGVVVEVILDVATNLVGRPPVKAGEEVIHVGVAEQVVTDSRRDTARHLGEVGGGATRRQRRRGSGCRCGGWLSKRLRCAAKQRRNRNRPCTNGSDHSSS